MAGLEGTSSAIRFDLDVFGLSLVEHNPGVEATGYGMLADFLRAVRVVGQTHTTTDCLLFPDIFDRPVVAKFDQRQGSSDGGAILLKAAERRLGLTSALAACLRDDRQPGKVQHELRELITQRVMAIALGYEDANDAARLACDPIHKLLVGRDPVDGEDLASQPTLSRFENAPNRKELLRMTEALAERVIERHRKRLHGRARRITIDLDPTDDPTHGAATVHLFQSPLR